MNTNHSSQHRPLVRAIGALTGLVIAAVAVGCSDVLGPVDSTEIQTTVNSMNESDITNDVIEKDENISNESGNPWGEFIDRAESTCEAPPDGFAVRSASLALVTEESTGVQALEDVIDGDATVHFLSTRGSDADAVRVNVARVTDPTGTGPVSMNVIASRQDLRDLRERMRGGDFHVGFRAETSRDSSSDFSMNVRIRFRARAFCS